MLNVFLDTEFTNFIDTDLISIGMVAQTGEEFYAEVPYPDAACSPFVREVVVPLLDREPLSFCSKPDLGRRILNWLNIVRPRSDSDVCICYDYETDWCLFADALDNQLQARCQTISKAASKTPFQAACRAGYSTLTSIEM